MPKMFRVPSAAELRPDNLDLDTDPELETIAQHPLGVEERIERDRRERALRMHATALEHQLEATTADVVDDPGAARLLREAQRLQKEAEEFEADLDPDAWLDTADDIIRQKLEAAEEQVLRATAFGEVLSDKEARIARARVAVARQARANIAQQTRALIEADG